MPPSSKKRRIMPAPKMKGPRPEEISFDLSSRQDYLTGFHKRKVQRTKAAQEAAERRAKEEKRVQRGKIREERKRELEERVKIVDAYMQPIIQQNSKVDGDSDSAESSDDGDGMEATEVVPEKVDHEAEYVDEDKYTSVVIEEVGVDRDGFVQASDSDGNAGADEMNTQATADTKPDADQKSTKRKWIHDKPRKPGSAPKKKRQKFRYESKAERRAERDKQRAKNSKQAKARRSG
jgi:ribosomal RNA-processing protein 17